MVALRWDIQDHFVINHKDHTLTYTQVHTVEGHHERVVLAICFSSKGSTSADSHQTLNPSPPKIHCVWILYLHCSLGMPLLPYFSMACARRSRRPISGARALPVSRAAAFSAAPLSFAASMLNFPTCLSRSRVPALSCIHSHRDVVWPSFCELAANNSSRKLACTVDIHMCFVKSTRYTEFHGFLGKQWNYKWICQQGSALRRQVSCFCSCMCARASPPLMGGKSCLLRCSQLILDISAPPKANIATKKKGTPITTSRRKTGLFFGWCPFKQIQYCTFNDVETA